MPRAALRVRPAAAVRLAAILLAASLVCVSARAQSNDTLRQHSPRGALWRAAAVPGWGQVYNGQYYKLPFVYGGLAGLAYAAWSTHQDYIAYRQAYWYAEPRLWSGEEPGYPQYEATYRRFLADNGLPADNELTDVEAAQRRQRLAPSLRQARDNLRRNRDLFYIGVGLFYGITIIDAYVSAHLLDFDVGEDLSLRVSPSPAGLHARVIVSF